MPSSRLDPASSTHSKACVAASSTPVNLGYAQNNQYLQENRSFEIVDLAAFNPVSTHPTPTLSSFLNASNFLAASTSLIRDSSLRESSELVGLGDSLDSDVESENDELSQADTLSQAPTSSSNHGIIHAEAESSVESSVESSIESKTEGELASEAFFSLTSFSAPHLFTPLANSINLGTDGIKMESSEAKGLESKGTSTDSSVVHIPSSYSDSSLFKKHRNKILSRHNARSPSPSRRFSKPNIGAASPESSSASSSAKSSPHFSHLQHHQEMPVFVIPDDFTIVQYPIDISEIRSLHQQSNPFATNLSYSDILPLRIDRIVDRTGSMELPSPGSDQHGDEHVFVVPSDFQYNRYSLDNSGSWATSRSASSGKTDGEVITPPSSRTGTTLCDKIGTLDPTSSIGIYDSYETTRENTCVKTK